MSTDHPNGSSASAAERFFRAYSIHCVAPDPDSLFNLLNAAHSLNDRLRKEFRVDFFSQKEFIAIKTLRNYFHHQDELLSDIRFVAAANFPITTDLLFLCLVPRSLAERAIASINERDKTRQEPLIRAALKWYGDVVNNNPCIFNFAVYVHEKVMALNLRLDCPEYAMLQESYKLEEQNSCSHFVSGDITCHAGSVETVLKTMFGPVV